MYTHAALIRVPSLDVYTQGGGGGLIDAGRRRESGRIH